MVMSHPSPARRPRIAILIVAYNAASALENVLDRIPEQVWDRVEEVVVFDDSSRDETYLVGLGYKALHERSKLSVFRNEKNVGYGGNQIRGYEYVIERGHDIVALLHGDGQYAPEMLPKLLEPLERGEADAVFGSRMLTPGGARQGGMPLYKYVGNKILTAFENATLGLDLSEWHSGYRLYSVAALKRLPFRRNSNEYHFDTQIIIQLHAAGMRIVEIPIPTFYGDEISYVNGFRYARDIALAVGRWELHQLGLLTCPEYEVPPAPGLQRGKLSSQSQLLTMVGPKTARILDIGCGNGELGHVLERRGHRVFGIDRRPPPQLPTEFVTADLEHEWPVQAERRFDIVLLSDVLMHVTRPVKLLEKCRQCLAPGGRVLVAVGNAVHWSVRMHVLTGRFAYTNQGLLERSHHRFFTRASALGAFAEAGLEVCEVRSAPTPWENVLPPGLGSFVPESLEKADHLLGRVAPNLFAYQHLFELRPRNTSGGT